MNDEQRQDLILYRLAKAKETLVEVESHIKNEFLNTAANRLYYSCFYAVNALLAEKDIFPKTHLGTRQMLALHFVKQGIISKELGKFYTDIFEMRHTGDYEDFFNVDKQEVIELLKATKELIARVEEILSTK